MLQKEFESPTLLCKPYIWILNSKCTSFCMCLSYVYAVFILFLSISLYAFLAASNFLYPFLDLDLESNSRTYLQELFGSFPSTNVNGDKVQHDDISEEEYEIYEQDSDDSYSGGDNDN